MKNFKGIIGALFIALCMALIVPSISPFTNITTVEAAKVKLSKTNATLIKKQTVQLEVKNTSQRATWTSTDTSIATVNKNGKVTAKKTGITTITATVNSKIYTCKIIVEDPRISQASLSLIKDSSTTVSVEGTTQKIKWTSSDKSVATVNKSGKITAKKNGKATIIATIGTKKYNCKITVSNKFSNSYLTKMTLYDSYKSLDNDSIIAKFYNNTTVNINISDISIVYYHTNGNMLYTTTASNNDIIVDSKDYGITYFRTPSDNFSSYKIIYTSRNAIGDTKYTSRVSLKNKISVNSSSSSNGVTASITNTSTKKLDSANISVVYYKNNMVIGQQTERAYDFESGTTQYVQFHAPWDENWDTTDFDKYEIYVFDAYYYKFN